MTPCSNVWVTVALGTLALVVAFGQWSTAKQRLRIDLFEKRFAVYQAARDFLRSVTASNRVGSDALTAYFLATTEAKWLFNKELAKFIYEEIPLKAQDLQMWDAELEDAELGHKKRKEYQQERRKIKSWLSGMRDTLDEKFAPSLTMVEESSRASVYKRWRHFFGLPIR